MARLILTYFTYLFFIFITMSCGSSSKKNCLTKGDCLAGEFCVSKQCDSVECRTNGDCVGTAFCINQRCQSNSTTGCSSNNDCNGGTCVLGTCSSSCVPKCNGSCGSDGCGGSCGSCSRGFKCSGSGSCELDPSTIWVITITKGQISESLDGDSWDFPGGLPDPRVCITINNERNCTASKDNTLSPIWNESFSATTVAIQTGVKAEIQDEDVTDFETICSEGLLSLNENNFKSGTFGAQCKYGSFEATITPK